MLTASRPPWMLRRIRPSCGYFGIHLDLLAPSLAVESANAARATPTQTGSIDKQPGVVALVPSVTGAPGDGSQALSAALRGFLVLRWADQLRKTSGSR